MRCAVRVCVALVIVLAQRDVGCAALLAPVGHGKVVVNQWYNRLGNNLIQLLHAVIAAEVLGRSTVEVPTVGTQGASPGGAIDDVLDLSKPITIISRRHPGISDELRAACLHNVQTGKGIKHSAEVTSSNWVGDKCANVSESVLRSFAIDYLAPLIRPQVFSACAANQHAEEGLLTVHIRSEDIFTGTQSGGMGFMLGLHPQVMQPPCATYEAMLASGSYSNMLVVTSEDRANPCVKWLQNRGAEMGVKVNVSRGNQQEDICTMLTAKNLVLSTSSFSRTLALMSRRLHRLYAPQNPTRPLRSPRGRTEDYTAEMDAAVTMELCESLPYVAWYKLPMRALLKMRHASDRFQWMTSFAKSQVPQPLLCPTHRQ